MYPSKAAADAAAAQARRNFEEAAAAGFIDGASIRRSEGPVIKNLLE